MAVKLLYIVDGYNVLHQLFPAMEREALGERRGWLAERLASLAALEGARAVIVFDARHGKGVTPQPLKGTPVEVYFAGGHLAADAFIARRIAEQPADVTVVVVSADQEVQRTASRAGVHRMTPRELASRLDDLQRAVANRESSHTMRSQLEDKVDSETLAKLEKMRTEGTER